MKAVPLTEPLVAQAFPLVGLLHEQVTLDTWNQQVEDDARPEPVSWIAIRDHRGYIHGLYSYRIGGDLQCGRALVAMELLVAGPGWKLSLAAMHASMSEIAVARGCDAIHLMLKPERRTTPPSAADIRDIFVAAGFKDCGGHLCRHLTGTCG